MSALLAALRTVPARFFRDQGFLLASAISFAALLCLAPLVLILFSLAGYLMESDKIADYLFDAATVLLPAYGRELGEFFSFLTRERAVAGLVGVLSWGIFTTQFFSVIRTVVNQDRKSTRLNSSHQIISYAVFCLKKKKKYIETYIRQLKT